MATSRTNPARQRSSTPARSAPARRPAHKLVRPAPAAPVVVTQAAGPSPASGPAEAMPGKDALIDRLKQRCAQLGHKAGKGTLQRAGLRLLAAQEDAALLAAVRAAAKPRK